MYFMLAVALIVGMFAFILSDRTRKYSYDSNDVKNVIDENRETIIRFLPYYPNIPLERVLSIVLVESSGNIAAVGDGIKSFGLMQIQQGALDDFNNFYNRNYSITQMLDRYYNIEVGIGYLNLGFVRYGSLDLATKYFNDGSNIDSLKAGIYLNKVFDAEILIKEVLKKS
jgi:soluble lytic murein transglycosylase-like protein